MNVVYSALFALGIIAVGYGIAWLIWKRWCE